MMRSSAVILVLLVSVCRSQRISHSGSDWYLRFRSERDLDRLETVSYRVVSAVDNDFVKTTVSRDIFNPANISQEYDLEIRLPQTAFISDIEIDQYKVEIVPRGEQHPSKHEDEEAEDQHDHGHYDHQETDQDEFENFDLFRLPVTVRAWDNVTLSVTYHDLLHTEGPVSRLEMFLSPGEIVRQFSVLVSLSRENISRTLVTAPVLGDVSNETVCENERLVNFTMNTREQAHYFGTNGAYGTLLIEIRTNQTSPDPKQPTATLTPPGAEPGDSDRDRVLLDYFLSAFQGSALARPTSKVSQLLKLHLLLDQSRKTMQKIGELSLENGWFTPLTNLKVSSRVFNSSEVFSYAELMSSKDKLLSQ